MLRQVFPITEKYFPFGVNALTNCFKISDTTKKDFFQLNFSQSNGQS